MKAIRRSLLVGVMAGGTLALVAGFVLSSPSAADSPRLLAAQAIDNRIESFLHSPQFAHVYAGDEIQPRGKVTIYVTPAGRSRVVGALARLLGTSGPSWYSLQTARHTEAALDRLTIRLDRDYRALAARGIHLVQWGPAFASSTVLARIHPYTAAAARALTRRYGRSWISVAPWVGQLPRVAAGTNRGSEGRNHDNPPYLGGDWIFLGHTWSSISGEECTTSFALRNGDTGQIEQLTAAHCDYSTKYGQDYNSDVSTNQNHEYHMGTIPAGQSYMENNGWDAAFLPCDCGGSSGGYVWMQGGEYHAVTGWCWCGHGSDVTPDGDVTGQVPGARVVSDGFVCATFDFPNSNQSEHPCDLHEIRGTRTLCQPGDSGGPVYQRESSDTYKVEATGADIVGYQRVQGAKYNYCWYETIDPVLNLVGGHLLTAG